MALIRIQTALTLAFALFTQTSWCADQALTIDEYLGTFLSTDEVYIEAELEAERARAEFESSRSLFISSATLTPLYGQNLITSESSTDSTRFRTWSLEGKLNQDFPSATRLSLGVSREWDLNTSPGFDLGQTEYSATLSQPLLKNSFGSLYRKRASALEAAYASARSQATATLLQECARGALLYSQAYIFHERSKIYDEIAGASEQAFKSTRSAFDRKLVRRSDLLSAEADRAQTEEAVINARVRLEKALAALQEAVVSKVELLPTTPQRFFDTLAANQTKSAIPATNPSIEAAKLLLTSAEEQVAATRDASRSDLDLTLRASQAENPQTLVTGDITQVRETRFQVGVTFTWPFWNPTLGYDIEQALKRQQIAERQFDRARKTLAIDWRQAASDANTLGQRVALSQKRIGLYREQLKLASGDMNRGRIEFEDYLRFRDRYLNEQLNLLDTTLERWQNLLALAALSGQAPAACNQTIPRGLQ